ncbi:MAG: hypothetical protein LBG19_10850 [Prevotellaceae bacterium]|nr:hypothetical protein [Prevotellaceae bacterium]
MPTDEEWRELIMSYTGITEEQLKVNAIQLYSLYILSENLFNHIKTPDNQHL